jgi:hypothetical protein
LSQCNRVIDAVRSLRGDVRWASTGPLPEGPWVPVTSVPEHVLEARLAPVRRALKRDYNYFEDLNEALRELADKRRNAPGDGSGDFTLLR